MYEWNEGKRQKNLAIHRVDFSAIESFVWEKTVVIQDTRKNYDETRFLALGPDRGSPVLRCIYRAREEHPHHQLEKGQQ